MLVDVPCRQWKRQGTTIKSCQGDDRDENDRSRTVLPWCCRLTRTAWRSHPPQRALHTVPYESG